MGYIADIETILGHSIKEIDYSEFTNKAINYHWGSQMELNRWLVAKDKEISGYNAFDEEANKYPLIWLAHPNKGEHLWGDDFLHRNTKLLFVCKAEPEHFNNTKWNSTMPMLTDLVEITMKGIQRNKNTSIQRNNGGLSISYEKLTNYYTSQNESKAIDIWDAIIVTTDLIINTKCLTTKTQQLCDNL